MAAKTPEKNQKLRLLLVDDSELVLRHVSALLEKRGHEVIRASSLSAGLEAFCTEKPDATLADFVLDGGQTGLHLIAAIFSLSSSLSLSEPGENGLRNPPAAILTLGQLAEDDQARAQYLGVPVLQKPTHGKEEEFLQRLEFWLHDAKLI